MLILETLISSGSASSPLHPPEFYHHLFRLSPITTHNESNGTIRRNYTLRSALSEFATRSLRAHSKPSRYPIEVTD